MGLNTMAISEQEVLRRVGRYELVLGGQIHVLRLSDGAHAAVASGAHARFVDSGLVYADGKRLRLIPFDRLPVSP